MRRPWPVPCRKQAEMCYTVHVMLKPEQIPYGVKDFKRIRLEHFYYVDKTAFIRKMEERADFLFFVSKI